MELTYQVLVGATAALLASLFNAALAPSYARLRARANDEWRAKSLRSQLAEIGVQLVAGAGLGMLFWLSWGLAAIVGVPWWLRGSSFALILWSVCCLPTLAIQLLATRLHWSTALIYAIEWLIIFAAVGLACSWGWAKAVQ